MIFLATARESWTLPRSQIPGALREDRGKLLSRIDFASKRESSLRVTLRSQCLWMRGLQDKTTREELDPIGVRTQHAVLVPAPDPDYHTSLLITAPSSLFLRSTMINRVAHLSRTSRLIAASLVLSLPACSPVPGVRDVPIHAADYAFRVQDAVPPGLAAFRLINDGKHWHELQLFRFRPGVSPDSARTLLAVNQIPDAARDSTGSVLIAGAGLSSRERILVQLTRGELYGLICDFRDADSLPRHSKLGMFKLVRIE